VAIKTALLVLDMQNELIDPKGKVGSKGFASVVAERKLVEKIAAAIAEMRRQKMPIVFVRVGFEPGYVDVLSRSARIAHLKEMNALVIGEFGTEFPAALAPMQDELVVTKRAVSPFHNTNLLGWLHRNGVQRVVLCGVYTHMVVDSTARFADDAGLLVTVLEDCCASPDPNVHKMEVEKVLPLFGTVSTLRAFLDELTGNAG
jgi:nicotinamidase-related amidase